MPKTSLSSCSRPVYLIDGSRTPFLKARRGPGPFSAADLAAAAGRLLLARQPFAPTAFDEVVLGCVMPGPDEANIARVCALRLGCGERMPAWTVQRNCGSGMQAVDSAARAIATGYADLVLAGGTEAMSHAPVLWGEKMVRWLADLRAAKAVGARAQAMARLRPAHLRPVIALLRGLTDPIVGLSMGQTAEVLAQQFGIDRSSMDEYALRSHQRLAQAQERGWLAEVETIFDADGRFYDADDGLRADSTLTQLAQLKPVFDRPYGNVTAGNSAQVTDGAAWLILASEEAVERHKLSVLAQIVDSTWVALDPAQMGLGPAHAAARLLQRNTLAVDDIDYWEINEAFAAQVLACLRVIQDPDYCRDVLDMDSALGAIDETRLNVDGGAVSLGHPVGASGARIVLHLARVLQRNEAQCGVASLCIGGGQGGAMLLQRAAATAGVTG